MASEARILRFTGIVLFTGFFAAMRFGWSSARDTNLERIAIDKL